MFCLISHDFVVKFSTKPYNKFFRSLFRKIRKPGLRRASGDGGSRGFLMSPEVNLSGRLKKRQTEFLQSACPTASVRHCESPILSGKPSHIDHSYAHKLYCCINHVIHINILLLQNSHSIGNKNPFGDRIQVNSQPGRVNRS